MVTAVLCSLGCTCGPSRRTAFKPSFVQVKYAQIPTGHTTKPDYRAVSDIPASSRRPPVLQVHVTTIPLLLSPLPSRQWLYHTLDSSYAPYAPGSKTLPDLTPCSCSCPAWLGDVTATFFLTTEIWLLGIRRKYQVISYLPLSAESKAARVRSSGERPFTKGDTMVRVYRKTTQLWL